ncbi:diacylglycerol/polyprenol kinase family protein [Altericista sp. CCNU0014]|uniref:diacylglycerol/polyprenol kinase family protein n=1 Tax=Altericista sp. CCNU0014 TaxID=3082949 RepID=UPI00384C2110
MFQTLLWHDAIAAFITLALALLWLRAIDAIAHRGWLEPKLSRKIVHIGTGPLFVLCWPLFSAAASARYFAALVPLSITAQFVAIGVGWLQDPAAVTAMTRAGNPREILRGPLYYGLVFVLCTICFWRTSPVGIVALMLMCGGDGLADIIGRRWGTRKLPFSPDKSWAGSAAMFGGSFAFAWGMLAWFGHLGLLALPLDETAGIVAAIALAATLVEALPFRDIDNLTLTGTAIVLGVWWL